MTKAIKDDKTKLSAFNFGHGFLNFIADYTHGAIRTSCCLLCCRPTCNLHALLHDWKLRLTNRSLSLSLLAFGADSMTSASSLNTRRYSTLSVSLHRDFRFHWVSIFNQDLNSNFPDDFLVCFEQLVATKNSGKLYRLEGGTLRGRSTPWLKSL